MKHITAIIYYLLYLPSYPLAPASRRTSVAARNSASISRLCRRTAALFALSVMRIAAAAVPVLFAHKLRTSRCGLISYRSCGRTVNRAICCPAVAVCLSVCIYADFPLLSPVTVSEFVVDSTTPLRFCHIYSHTHPSVPFSTPTSLNSSRARASCASSSVG